MNGKCWHCESTEHDTGDCPSRNRRNKKPTMTKYYGYISFEFEAQNDSDAVDIAESAWGRVRNMAEIQHAELGEVEADIHEPSTG